jgi:hypothetical protein
MVYGTMMTERQREREIETIEKVKKLVINEIILFIDINTNQAKQ